MRIVHLFISLITPPLLTLGHTMEAGGGTWLTPEQYISQWKETAVRNMKEHGIPASITLAQGLLESRNGNSDLARVDNNHFGIKCTPDWTGGKTYHDDDKKNDCFRKYKKAEDSFEDHSKFLLRARYASLFELKPTDYKGWAHGLKKCGYATDSHYAQKLIDLIERYGLNKLDQGIDIDPQPKDAPVVQKPGRKKPANSDETVTIGAARPVEKFEGRIKFIHAKAGDTYATLAEELEMMPGQLARYNDREKSTEIHEGDVIYLQPKRSQSKTAEAHNVRAGDTLWSISQQYGVKLKKLAQYNGMSTDASLKTGMRIVLKKQKR